MGGGANDCLVLVDATQTTTFNSSYLATNVYEWLLCWEVHYLSLVTIKITISSFVVLSSSWLKMTYCWLDVKRQSFNYTVRYITNTNNVINIIIIILILTTTAQNDTLHLYIVWKLNSWKSTLKINKLQLRSFSTSIHSLMSSRTTAAKHHTA